VEAVRHFLGFADDSDARVVKNCVLAQISYRRRAAAEDDWPQSAAAQVLGFAKHLWRAWKDCVWRRLLVRCR
jgi:hypothetical protein